MAEGGSVIDPEIGLWCRPRRAPRAPRSPSSRGARAEVLAEIAQGKSDTPHRRVACSRQAGRRKAHQLDLFEAESLRGGRRREQAGQGRARVPHRGERSSAVAISPPSSDAMAGATRLLSHTAAARKEPVVEFATEVDRALATRYGNRFLVEHRVRCICPTPGCRPSTPCGCFGGTDPRGRSAAQLATFVTTWMEPEAQRIIAANVRRNLIDHAEYPRTAEIEQRCFLLSPISFMPRARPWVRAHRVRPRRTCSAPCP